MDDSAKAAAGGGATAASQPEGGPAASSKKDDKAEGEKPPVATAAAAAAAAANAELAAKPEGPPAAAEKKIESAAATVAASHQGSKDSQKAKEAEVASTTVAPNKKEVSEDDDDDDSGDDDEEEVVESSPCNRYHKRRDVVRYRDIPGIDEAYLAMDSEEGVEVVWNEAKFSSAKRFRAQEENMKNVFEALTLIDHPNIVKFHKFWTDLSGEWRKQPRLIFITEYMSSGSLKQFLKTTKRNNRKVQLQSWKRWCIQILSALNHLHTTCDPPIIHGNLNCDTIFIQHNGLVKIGSVAPDIINHNVKTCKDNLRNLHFFAPEWGEDRNASGTSNRGPPMDIYAFGMAALETAALDILVRKQSTPPPSGSGEPGRSGAATPTVATEPAGVSPLSALLSTATGVDPSGAAVTEEAVQHTIDQLEDPLQKDFIRKCLSHDPEARPSAGSLLFHPVLFEVHSLKLLAAHVHVNTPANTNTENVTDEAIQLHYGRDTVMAAITHADGTVKEFRLSDFKVAEKLEKFMEDVKFGIYPITAFALSQPSNPKTRSGTPEEHAMTEAVVRKPKKRNNKKAKEAKAAAGAAVGGAGGADKAGPKKTGASGGAGASAIASTDTKSSEEAASNDEVAEDVAETEDAAEAEVSADGVGEDDDAGEQDGSSASDDADEEEEDDGNDETNEEEEANSSIDSSGGGVNAAAEGEVGDGGGADNTTRQNGQLPSKDAPPAASSTAATPVAAGAAAEKSTTKTTEPAAVNHTNAKEPANAAAAAVSSSAETAATNNAAPPASSSAAAASAKTPEASAAETPAASAVAVTPPVPLDAATKYVTNLKVISSLVHFGPPVPKLYEYIVGVNRLEKSMNRQFSTWVSAQDSPILLGASQIHFGLLRKRLVVVFVSMLTRGIIQRGREISEFWEHYQAYEANKAEKENRPSHVKQPLPLSLKVTQDWLLDLAKNFGFLDDRQGINDHQKAPEGMIWIHDADADLAADWIWDHKDELLTAYPPVLYAHPDFEATDPRTAPAWMAFEKKCNGPALNPCLVEKPPLQGLWPKWQGTQEAFSYEPFPEDSPTKRLLAYLNEQRQLNPEYSGAAGEEVAAPTEAPPVPPVCPTAPGAATGADASATDANAVGGVDQAEAAAAVAAANGELHRVLQAQVEAFHFNYEMQHGADEDFARIRAAAQFQPPPPPPATALQQVQLQHPEVTDGGGSGLPPLPVNPGQLQEALMAAAARGAAAANGGHPIAGDINQTDGACSLESFVTTTASDPSSFGHVPSSATLDSLMSDDERFNQLCEQMQRLPQLDDPSSQSYMVVPETPDGQQGTPFVLDPSQLAHLQALAQPFLQNTFQQFYYNTGDNSVDNVSAAAMPAAAAAAASNGGNPAVPASLTPLANAAGGHGGGGGSTGLVSSPSIDDEEIARLHLGESDDGGDNDRDPPTSDIAAAAAATAAAQQQQQPPPPSEH